MKPICRASIAVALLCAYVALLPSHASATNDFYYSRQWYSEKLNLPQVWATNTGSPSVTVAILDDGVISTTPDLAGRILPALSAVPNQAPFTDSWLSSVNMVGNTDEYSLRRHGTWVASVAAMGVNNEIGGAGVGNFSILPIRITDTNISSSETWIAKGIRMAADNGAKVINVSYLANDYATLDSAAAYARSKGALTVIAAGNTNGVRYIDEFSNLIFVGGTGPNDQRWVDPNDPSLGSSYGSFIDITAPAGGFDGAMNKGILLADPTLPNGYGLNSGTSFAAPLVAGAAAMAWSINPNLTPYQVEQMLYSSAVNMGTLGAASTSTAFGRGRLNIYAVEQAALATVPEPAMIVMLASAGIAFFLWRKKR